MGKANKTPRSEGKDTKKEDDGTKVEFIKQVPTIITAIGTLIGAIGGLLVILHQIGAFPFSPTPTPTLSSTPTATWTTTLAPTETPAPTWTPAFTETPALTPNATQTLPTVAQNERCPWLPFSTLNPAIAIGKNCLNDLLSLGISETDQILFYREQGMNIGVFGISRKVETSSEYSVFVSLKTLNAIRFLAVLSQNKTGYQHSIGFRILREGNNKKLIQLVRFDPQGFDSVVANTPELDLWGGNLKLTLKFSGPQARAYVNDTYFGQTQIDFADRYLFLGYQVMSGGTSRPYIDLSVRLP